jgi:hypothetical protein
MIYYNQDRKTIYGGKSKMKNIEIKNNVPGLKVTVDENDANSVVITINEKSDDIELGKVECGKVVKIGSRSYIVLGHGEETTAVLDTEFVKKMEFGNDGNYAKSDVRKFLNENYYNKLCKEIGRENIVQHKVKLTADDGTDKGVICRDYVSLITNDLYRRYREYIPAYGSWWWTATRVSNTPDYARGVCYVGSGGALGWFGCGFCGGVRPFLILKSSILILEDE